MTATAHISGRADAVSSLRTAGLSDMIVCAVTSVILLVMFLLLQNPYWVPGGDSEVYTAIARNLVAGKGYTFNGWKVSMVPPGWAWLMALVMWISPTFLALKLVNMSCMLGSLIFSYWICRRFASPVLSSLVILLTGILSYVYSLTFWLHSDALFCLTSSASLLLAMQINEGRNWKWRIPLLIALCGINVIVRWAGLFSWLLVAAALLSGHLRIPWSRTLPSMLFTGRIRDWRQSWEAAILTQSRKVFSTGVNRYWIAVLLSGVVTFATFQALRMALTVTRDEARQIKASGGEIGGGEESAPAVPTADANVATTYSLFNPTHDGIFGLVGRAGTWGNWMSFLLWQPFRLAQANPLLGMISVAIGWTVLVPLLIQGFRAAVTGQWLWIAVLIYSFALAMNWPNANARYIVPIAPFIILGVFKALEWIRLRFPERGVVTTTKVLAGYFVASILLCNGALYACDVWAARSDDFYATYEAGLNKDLIAAAKWLNEQNVADGQIAVCERYVNLGRVKTSRLGLRATTMLTGKAIVSVPMRYLRSGDPRGNRHFLAWCRSEEIGVKYVLYQPEVSPWRVFHFRMGWLQEAMTDAPAIDTGAGWRLYEIPPQGEEAVRISLPPTSGWPTRVPGAEQAAHQTVE